jgi:hypothetical protein
VTTWRARRRERRSNAKMKINKGYLNYCQKLECWRKPYFLSKRRFYWRFHAAKAKNKLNSNANYPRNYPFSPFFFLSFFFYCVAQLYFEASFDRPFLPSIGALKNPIVEQKLIIKSYTTYIRCTVKDTVHAGEIRVSLWLQVAHNSQATGSTVTD